MGIKGVFLRYISRGDKSNSPTRAPKTKSIQESIQASIAVSPSAFGVLVVTFVSNIDD